MRSHALVQRLLSQVSMCYWQVIWRIILIIPKWFFTILIFTKISLKDNNINLSKFFQKFETLTLFWEGQIWCDDFDSCWCGLILKFVFFFSSISNISRSFENCKIIRDLRLALLLGPWWVNALEPVSAEGWVSYWKPLTIKMRHLW